MCPVQWNGSERWIAAILACEQAFAPLFLLLRLRCIITVSFIAILFSLRDNDMDDFERPESITMPWLSLTLLAPPLLAMLCLATQSLLIASSSQPDPAQVDLYGCGDNQHHGNGYFQRIINKSNHGAKGDRVNLFLASPVDVYDLFLLRLSQRTFKFKRLNIWL